MQPAARDLRAPGADPQKAQLQSSSGFLDFVHAHGLRRTERTAACLAAVRSDPTASAVHDLRVAARRLVYTLDCFSTLLDADRAADFRKRVKSILSAARPVRELDVALELVSEEDPGPGCALADVLRRRRDTAERTMRERLDRKRVQNLAQRWLSTASSSAHESGRDRLGAIVTDGRPFGHLPWMPDQSCSANASAILPMLAANYFRQGRAACRAGRCCGRIACIATCDQAIALLPGTLLQAVRSLASPAA